MNTFISYPGGGVSAPPTGAYPLALANPQLGSLNPQVIRTTTAAGAKRGIDFAKLLGQGKAAAIKGAQGAGKFAGAYAPLIGGAMELAEGDVAGAVGSTAGGYLGALAGQVLIPIPGVGAGVGAIAGSMLGSGVADATKNLLPDLEIAGLAIGERAKRRKEAAYQRGESEKDIKLQQKLQSEYLTGTLAPFLDQQRRQQVTAQQSLLNTQGAIYQKLARTAGSFQLAGQGMAESGALARTALANNPYAGATIKAPNITFGRG